MREHTFFTDIIAFDMVIHFKGLEQGLEQGLELAWGRSLIESMKADKVPKKPTFGPKKAVSQLKRYFFSVHHFYLRIRSAVIRRNPNWLSLVAPYILQRLIVCCMLKGSRRGCAG